MRLPPRVTDAVLAAPRPVYVYDLATVRDNVRALRAALPAGARIAYAMKANGNSGVVAAALRWCDGLEVASGGELAAAVAAGSPFTLFSGPAKSDGDLRAAVAAGVVVNVESGHELRRLVHVAGGRPVRVCLRVNRAHAALPGSHRMSGAATAFGIEEPLLAGAVAAARAGGLDVAGFHLHAVSNNLDAAAHAAFVAEAAGWAARTAAALDVPLEIINVGGGFGVDVLGRERFDPGAFAAGLAGLPPELGSRLVVEPGRFVTATAGWYAVEVVDVKRNHGRWFAVVRGGTHHFRLPASWGYSHPFTVLPVDDWPYPFERPTVTGVPVDVAGEQCNPRDVLARDVAVAAVRAGDVLVFANTGAYGWEVAHHDFLRLGHPAFVLLAVDVSED
ncbi:alanine racemase [Dactylosporangium roseum]|uniref:Alanine racemase n=1 Tax=Dactylosporangium roseum TaxID=47989 RepID=A0ABY5YZG4_9ACTN|nr:alanine racemase [Dactylosporangium roseum]UWZ33629.1 alanine racemase [Dactylosporangium roseum]